MQREAGRIVELLQDPGRTAVHLVTLAEEMPVTEALEAHAEITGPLRLPLGLAIVNRLHRRTFAPEVLAGLEAAAARSSAAERALLAAVAERAVEESGWAAINAQYLARLRSRLAGVPIVELPFLFVEEFDRAALGRLSEALEAQVAAPPRAAAKRRS